MTNYYRTTNIVNKQIDKIIKNMTIGQKISRALFLYEITLTYEISEKYVNKRLDLIEEAGKIKSDGKYIIKETEA